MRTTRGAIWRTWDLHIHTTASFHPHGRRFYNFKPEEREADLAKIVQGLNDADAAVFGVMDYWTFDGYIALRQHVKAKGDAYLKKRVFPGIELRLVAPANYRLNVHALFSDELSDQELNDFKGRLKLAFTKMPLSHERLIEYGRGLGADKLEKLGLTPREVNTSEEHAWLAGAKTAEIDPNSFLEAFEVLPKDKALVFMPFDTNDGLGGVKWAEHYAYAKTFIGRPEVFESRDPDLRAAFLGVETPNNKKYLTNFQAALGNKPRLVVAGSDGHSAEQYGKFPGERATWIKAEPTFLGLLQAIKEPGLRSFIGDIPPKVKLVNSRKTYFVDRISVKKEAGALPAEEWFNDTDLPLNHDLVAIIGNKGSGKSALADIIALPGDARNSAYFSFLNASRFRAESNARSKHFTAEITWVSEERKSKLLSHDPAPESVERIKYIPQEFFEELCNEHVEGRTDKLERELRQVIFSHIDPTEALGQTSFDGLLNLKEKELVENQRALREELRKVNAELEATESRLHPSVKQMLEAKLTQKKKEIEEHDKLKPADVPAPTGQPTPEQQHAIQTLKELEKVLQQLSGEIEQAKAERKAQIERLATVDRLGERLKQVERFVDNLKKDLASDLQAVGLSLGQLVTLTVDRRPLKAIQEEATAKKGFADKVLDSGNKESASAKLQAALAEQTNLRAILDEQNKKYQEYLQRKEEWEKRKAALIGNEQTPESLKAIEAELMFLAQLPERKTALEKQRSDLAREIFKSIESQRKLREGLYSPVQALIERDPLIREEYKLQFQTFISIRDLQERLFAFVRQNTGTFRGDEEGRKKLREILEKHDTQTENGVIGLAEDILNAVQYDLRTEGHPPMEMSKVLRAGQTSRALYDFLFGLEYLEPRYSLLFQETPIEKLSPGQRGALLLIFYLLVDKDEAPIVLDQPEENLDNETVFSLLVPVVKQAKQRRQVIIVTHNPNLGVVCDAEQIIHARFDRKDKHRVVYTSGPIEDPEINRLVVNVLEGTKKAFDNRGGKYHEER